MAEAPRRVVFVLVGLGVFLGLILLVALRRQAPDIPADELHAPLPRRPDTCMSCHGASGAAPRGPNHPLGNNCWGCHFESGEAR